MDSREPITLQKHESFPQTIIREFVPNHNEVSKSAGRIVVRANNFGCTLDKFDELFDAVVADALQFEPPVQIERDDVQVVHFAGKKYKGTYGLEVPIPAGVTVSESYTRISQLEDIL